MHERRDRLGLRTLLSGGTVVINDVVDHLDPADVWRTIETEKVSGTLMVGEAFARPLLDELERGEWDATSVRVIIVGGAVTSLETKRRIVDAMPAATILDMAGASETGSALQAVSTSSGLGESGLFTCAEGVAIFDETLTHVEAPGHAEPGWLAKSGAIPLGYLGDESKTRRTFPVINDVRWSIPGDRARLRSDGRVQLLGRDSVTINTGGEKVFAEEVESAMLRYPSIKDVVVVGRTSERWGHEVVAVASRNTDDTDDIDENDENDLYEFLGRSLARYKLPKHIVWVVEVARSPAGKVDYRWARRLVEFDRRNAAALPTSLGRSRPRQPGRPRTPDNPRQEGGIPMPMNNSLETAVEPDLLADYKRQLEEDGYCIIPGVLSEAELDALRRRIKEQAEAERALGIGYVEDGTALPGHGQDAEAANQRVMMLINKGQEFVDLVTHPVAMELNRHVLGQHFLLMTFTSNIARLGALEQVLHCDDSLAPRPHRQGADFVRVGDVVRWNTSGETDPSVRAEYLMPPSILNFAWMMTDYTEENGGTRVVPGTHLSGATPKASIPHEIPSIAATGKAGSLMAFDGRLWHGTGRNTTPEERIGLLSCYTGPQFRTFENYFVGADPEVIENGSDLLRELLGFKMFQSYGRAELNIRMGVTLHERRVGPLRLTVY